MVFAAAILLAFCLRPQAPKADKIFDRQCQNGVCTYLLERAGHIVDLTPLPPGDDERRVVMGDYAANGQHLVPEDEAPIKVITTPEGWTLVVSGALTHVAPTHAFLRTRIFAPDGRLAVKTQGPEDLTLARLGRLFGGASEIAVVCNSGTQGNSEGCRAWNLLAAGTAKLIFYKLCLSLDNFQASGPRPGFRTMRKFLIGGDPDLYVVRTDTWVWEPKASSLVRAPHAQDALDPDKPPPGQR